MIDQIRPKGLQFNSCYDTVFIEVLATSNMCKTQPDLLL